MAKILCKSPQGVIGWRNESSGTSGYRKFKKNGVNAYGWHLGEDAGTYLTKDGNSIGWRYKSFISITFAEQQQNLTVGTAGMAMWAGTVVGIPDGQYSLTSTPITIENLPANVNFAWIYSTTGGNQPIVNGILTLALQTTAAAAQGVYTNLRMKFGNICYSNYFTLTIASAVPVTATFNYNYSGSPTNPYATVTGNSGSGIGTANMPANPTRTNYHFVGWNTSSSGTDSNFTGTTVLNGNVTVYAVWSGPYALNVTLSPSSGGSVTKSPNYTRFNANVNVTLTASPFQIPPDNFYAFSSWSGAITGSTNPQTINIGTADKSITANFTKLGGGTNPGGCPVHPGQSWPACGCQCPAGGSHNIVIGVGGFPGCTKCGMTG